MNESRFAWQQGSPAENGLDGKRLQEWQDGLISHNTECLLLIRNDRIVVEWYGEGYAPDTVHYTASLAKSLVGGMSLALAMDGGLIDPLRKAAEFIPSWRDHPQKSQITVEHLATHTSGLADAHQENVPHNHEEGWIGAFWRGRNPDSGCNSYAISIDETPLVAEPGTKFIYSNPGMAVLAYVVTASLQETPYPDLRTLLRQRVMQPIGVEDRAWSVGYGHTFMYNGLPLVANWGGGAYTPRAAAAVGRLLLRRGDWEGRCLLGRETVDRMLAHHGTPLPRRREANRWPVPVLGWYTNADGVWPQVPVDAFCGLGAGHQFMAVIPSLNLILVRNGGQLIPDAGTWRPVEELVLNPPMAALT
ncbi:MAG: serine hydrolase domain-containing protein [Limnochordia bacterium]